MRIIVAFSCMVLWEKLIHIQRMLNPVCGPARMNCKSQQALGLTYAEDMVSAHKRRITAEFSLEVLKVTGASRR